MGVASHRSFPGGIHVFFSLFLAKLSLFAGNDGFFSYDSSLYIMSCIYMDIHRYTPF